MSQDRYAKRIESLNKAIMKAVENAPTIKGLSVKDVASSLNVPEPTAYSYLERLIAEGSLGYTTFGKTKIYLKKRRS